MSDINDAHAFKAQQTPINSPMKFSIQNSTNRATLTNKLGKVPNRREYQAFSMFTPRLEWWAHPEARDMVCGIAGTTPRTITKLEPFGTKLAFEDCLVIPESALATCATVKPVPGAIWQGG
jgi:hypothetical protein